MRIKLNVPDETEMLFLVKCEVTASMRRIIYHVHIHLSQLSGSVLYGNCNCRSGLVGCCKHVAAALYQLIDFKMCGVKSIPDDKTCTDILQQWNIPGEQKQTNALPFENLNFEKAIVERDIKDNRKKPLVCGKRDFCATPMSSRGGPSDEKLRQFHDKLNGINQGNYLGNLLAGNNFKKCTFYSTSVSEIRSKDQREVGNVDYSQIAEIFDIFVDDYDKTLLSNDDIDFVDNHLPSQKSVLIVIETNTR